LDVRTLLDPLLADAVSSLSDEEIVTRVLDGDTALFELIVRRYNQRLFRATRGILRDDAEAEDAMQEAYLCAFAKLDQFAGEAKFGTWLTKIAVHEALRRLRRTKPHEELAEPMDNSGNPERAAYNRQLHSAMESAVDALPPAYRSVFILRQLEDMNVAETAECLGISEENVKTRLHRARALLRGELERVLGAAATSSFRYLGARCDRMTREVMDRIRELSRER
jgi:RNA polymerase sigma-70 factor (ECF subfamily)